MAWYFSKEKRALRREERRLRLERDSAFAVCKMIATWMDRRFLDPIIGFFFPGLMDVVTQVLVLPFVYVTLIEVRSVPLTLAVVFNALVDALIGTVPWLGDVIDFFHRSHVENYNLIVGFVEGDEEIVRKVNRNAIWCAVGIVLCCVAIYFMIKLLAWLWGIVFNS